MGHKHLLPPVAAGLVEDSLWMDFYVFGILLSK